MLKVLKTLKSWLHHSSLVINIWDIYSEFINTINSESESMSREEPTTKQNGKFIENYSSENGKQDL